MQLYNFFRSGAAYRVRIALNLKGVSYEYMSIDLLKDGGRHRSPQYRAINPQMRVPALGLNGDGVLLQSLAIIEYLEETFPEPALLPCEPVQRARARAVSQIIVCDTHPIINSGTLAYLHDQLGQDKAAVRAWYAHWIQTGFEAVEALIEPDPFAMGRDLSIADLCIVPQFQSAQRAGVPVERFQKICSVEAACRDLPAFMNAHPDRQPDTYPVDI